MMKKSLLLGLAFTAVSLAGSVQAQNVPDLKHEFSTPIRASALVTKPNNTSHMVNGAHSNFQAQPQYSDVFLMNIPLTGEQKAMLQTFKSDTNNMMSAKPEPVTSLPSQVQLGMNNVPVLDQGMHGTCVTFATTGALDALYNRGDYISQLCSLEIGNYLTTRSYLPSGWEGSYGPLILDRFREFGLVTMANQTTKGCAGVTQYPRTQMDNTGVSMTLEEYASMSEDINFDIYWYPILTPYERFSTSTRWDNNQADKLLNTVKSALASKDAKANVRLTFGVILLVNHCSVGACAKHNQSSDTWALTKSIRDDQKPSYGGHEMIITGYDDNATAVDNEGVTHKGLLTLRNSWSDKHGDNGDYYMTYDYFKHYTMEVQEVGKDTN